MNDCEARMCGHPSDGAECIRLLMEENTKLRGALEILLPPFKHHVGVTPHYEYAQRALANSQNEEEK